MSHACPPPPPPQYLFVPAKYKDCYLAYVLSEYQGQSALIFAATCNNAQRCTFMLRNLGFAAVCLHGQMSQPKRLGALNKFKVRAPGGVGLDPRLTRPACRRAVVSERGAQHSGGDRRGVARPGHSQRGPRP